MDSDSIVFEALDDTYIKGVEELTLLAIDEGIKVLDEKKPEWRDKIWKGCLNLANPYTCILGQVYGFYEDGEVTLCPILDFHTRKEWAMSHGFISVYGMSYGRLTELWLQKLNLN